LRRYQGSIKAYSITAFRAQKICFTATTTGLALLGTNVQILTLMRLPGKGPRAGEGAF
jgi:hypothetical protein